MAASMRSARDSSSSSPLVSAAAGTVGTREESGGESWERPGSAPGPFLLRGTGPGLAGLARVERQLLHVCRVGALAAAAYLSVGGFRVGFAGFALESGDQAALAALAVRPGVFSRPSGIGGDLGAQRQLLRGEGCGGGHGWLLRAGTSTPRLSRSCCDSA